MLSGKNMMYIALLAIAGVLIYYFFFRKKEMGMPKTIPDKSSGGNVAESEKSSADSDVSKSNEVSVKPSGDQSYVGPQDCAENCNLPYHNRILFCYNRMDGASKCFEKAEKLKQDCLGKCSETIPRYKDLEEVATPLQENNYSNELFNNLFNQGYV